MENSFLLVSACHDVNSKLVMYFIVNTAFVNYQDQIGNLTETLETPILMDKTTFQQTLPISWNVSNFDMELLTVPKTLKDFIHQYKCKKEMFDLEKRHASTDTNLPTKNFFSSNFILDVFLFVAAIILILVTFWVIYLLCKHMKFRMLVTNLALQQIKEVGAVKIWEDVIINTCKIWFYTILALSFSILGLVLYAILLSRKFKMCRRSLFSNVVKIMLFISKVQYYVPLKLCKTAGSIHLFKITGMLTPENVKLKWNYITDIIEIDWNEVNVTLNENRENLPKSVTIKLKDKFKIRNMMKREPLLFHTMLKQGLTWFNLASNTPETV